MKHAGAAALDQLEPLLAQIRAAGTLKEKSPGCFYFKSRGFLHFHEDPKGMFADIRAADGKDFDRLQVDTDEAREQLMRMVTERT